MTIEWGTAVASHPGQRTSGDLGVVVAFPGGALVAVIDGLGHGEEANKAAQAAGRVLTAQPQAPVAELVQRCHQELRGTRGAVMSIASFDEQHETLSWLGVGNVEGFLVRAQRDSPAEAIAMRGGTVGFNLPPLHPRTLSVHYGDTLVFASDGIKHGFKAAVSASRSCQDIADAVLRGWSRATDDACVVVARYSQEVAA